MPDCDLRYRWLREIFPFCHACSVADETSREFSKRGKERILEAEKKPVFEPWNALRGVGSSIHTNRRLVELKAPKCVLESAAKTLENGLQRLEENEVEVATEIKRRLGILAKKSTFEVVAREIGRIDIPDAELPPRDERLIKEAIEFHIDGLKKDGEPVPSPASDIEFVEVAAA